MKMFSAYEIEMAVYIIDSYIEDEEDTEYTIKVAVDEHNKIVGYICICKSDLSDTYWEILWMLVVPGMHRGNIGTTLIKKAEEIVLENKGVGITLETSSRLDYKPAREFYKTMGYKAVCKIRDFYSLGNDKLVYEKRLDKTDDIDQLLSSVLSAKQK
jgi:GNAT superfamily N-acetyltransferase